MYQNYYRICLSMTLVILLIALPIFCQTPSPSLTARDIAQQTLPSVVALLFEGGGAEKASYGSGFFIERDVVVTNYHVVE